MQVEGSASGCRKRRLLDRRGGGLPREGVGQGKFFLVTVGAFLLTVELLCFLDGRNRAIQIENR